MAKFRCPAGCDGVTLLDQYYAADKNGVVEVPDIMHDLEQNGYVRVVETAPAPAKADKASAK